MINNNKIKTSWSFSQADASQRHNPCLTKTLDLLRINSMFVATFDRAKAENFALFTSPAARNEAGELFRSRLQIASSDTPTDSSPRPPVTPSSFVWHSPRRHHDARGGGGGAAAAAAAARERHDDVCTRWVCLHRVTRVTPSLYKHTRGGGGGGGLLERPAPSTAVKCRCTHRVGGGRFDGFQMFSDRLFSV